MCDSRDSNKSVFQNVLVSLELTIGIVFHSLIVIAFVFGYQSGERGMLFYFVCYQYISICGFSIASQFVTVKEICIVCTSYTRALDFKGVFLMEKSENGSLIQDNLDQGASEEPKNPFPDCIYRFP